MTQLDFGFRSSLASGALQAFIIVDLQSDGTIAAAAIGTKGIGVTQEDIADAQYGNVKLWSAPGTFMIQATGTAVTAGTTYGVTTGGRLTPVVTASPALVKALANGVSSNGIVVECLLA